MRGGIEIDLFLVNASVDGLIEGSTFTEGKTDIVRLGMGDDFPHETSYFAEKSQVISGAEILLPWLALVIVICLISLLNSMSS